MSALHSSTVRAVFYGRCSTDRQERSIGEQKEWAKEAARRESVTIVSSFEDEGIPGGLIAERPGLQSLLAFVEAEAKRKRPLSALLLWDADRLSRADSIETAGVLKRLLDAGISRVLTSEGWLDLEDDTDRTVFLLRQDMGRSAFSRNLGKSMARSAASRAREGKWPCGRPPYGYIIGPDGRLALGDPREIELVQYIFHRYATTTDSLGDLAAALNRDGWPTPRDRRRKSGLVPKWTRTNVRTILVNPIFIGHLLWARRSYGRYFRIGKGDPQRRRRAEADTFAWNDPDDAIRVENTHPAMVDQATYDAVQRRLVAMRWKRTTPQAGGGDWVLSGLVFCGRCGVRMTGRTERHKLKKSVAVYRRYVCVTKEREGTGCDYCGARQDELLNLLAKELKEAISHPERRKDLGDRLERDAAKRTKRGESQLVTLRQEVVKLDALLAQAARRLILIPEDQLPKVTAEIRQWEAKRQQMAADLSRLEATATDQAKQAGQARDAIEALSRLEEIIAKASPSKVRNLLGTVLKKVTLHFEDGPEQHYKKQGKAVRRTPHKLVRMEMEVHPEIAYLFSTRLSREQVCTFTITVEMRQKPRTMRNRGRAE